MHGSKLDLHLLSQCHSLPHVKCLSAKAADPHSTCLHNLPYAHLHHMARSTYSKLCYTLQHILKLRGLLRGRA